MNIHIPTKQVAQKLLLDQCASGDHFLQAVAFLAQHSTMSPTIDVVSQENQFCDIGEAVSGLTGVGLLLHKLKEEPKKGLVKSKFEKMRRKFTVEIRLPQTLTILRRGNDWIPACLASLDLIQFLIDYSSGDDELFAPALLVVPCGKNKHCISISLLHKKSIGEQRLTIYYDYVPKEISASNKQYQVTRVAFCGTDLFRRMSG